MTDKEKEHIGFKLRKVREEFNLTQDDWAKLLQVTPNTVARWERGEQKLTGAHKKKAEHMIEIFSDADAARVIKKMFESGAGLAAVAALLGMLFGVLGYLGVGLSVAKPILKSKTSLLTGIEMFTKNLKDKKEF